MIEAAKGQTPDSPQNSATEAFHRRMSVLATLIALGVASPGCGATTQHTAENPTTNENEHEEEEEDEEWDEEQSISNTPQPESDTSEPLSELTAEIFATEETPITPEPPASDEEDMRTMWEKIADKVKAAAFKKVLEEKCEEKGKMFGKTCSKTAMTAIDEVRKRCEKKTGILAKICSKATIITADKVIEQCEEKGEMFGETCSKTAILVADQICIQIDELKLKPTIKAVCGHEDIGKFCTGKNEEILGAFLAYCAEERQEPKAS